MLTKALKEIYYNPEESASFGGVNKLYRSAKQAGVEKITRGRRRQFLADQQSFELHKSRRRHCNRNRIYVNVIDAQSQADLAEMAALTRGQQWAEIHHDVQ